MGPIKGEKRKEGSVCLWKGWRWEYQGGGEDEGNDVHSTELLVQFAHDGFPRD